MVSLVKSPAHWPAIDFDLGDLPTPPAEADDSVDSDAGTARFTMADIDLGTDDTVDADIDGTADTDTYTDDTVDADIDGTADTDTDVTVDADIDATIDAHADTVTGSDAGSGSGSVAAAAFSSEPVGEGVAPASRIDWILDEEPASEEEGAGRKGQRGVRRGADSKRDWFKRGPLAPVRVRTRQTQRMALLSLNSPLMLSAPMFLLALSSMTDYLILTNATSSGDSLFFSEMPVPFEDGRRDGAESLKSGLQAVLYVFAMGLCVFHVRKVLAYFREVPHMALMVVVLMFGTLHSIDPIKVTTNTVQIVIGMLIVILFAIGQGKSPQRFENYYYVILLPMFLLHFASFMLLFAYGVDIPSFLLGSERYGGLMGNPNTLGSTAVVGIWAAGCLALTGTRSRARRQLAWLSIGLFCFSIAISGSGTALATVLVLGVIMVWMRMLAAFTPSVRFGLNLTAVGLSGVALLAILVAVTPAEVFLYFTDSLGKDATLTGRTELWQIARDAIAERPVFGWGFDTHESVKSIDSYFVRFNHYHNGFLDTLVAGGVVLMALVLYNMVRFVMIFAHAFRKNRAMFPLALPLVILIIHNSSEYSLVRPLSQQWQVYLGVFVLLTWQQVKLTSAKRARPVIRRATAVSRKTVRWA